MIVVDTNILVHALVEGPRTAPVRQLRDREPSWRVPPFWRWEFANVMATAVKTGRLSRDQARSILVSAETHFAPLERPLPSVEALDSALDRKLSGYDGAYLALARRLSVKLVTEDRKLQQAAGVMACSVEERLEQL